MAHSGSVVLSKDLGEFFRQEVEQASGTLGVRLSDLIEYYVVNLLCDFSRSVAGRAPGEEPLALIYKRASEASLADRARLLKQLGDVSLYVAGFFAEFIERSLVDLDYYIAMGGSAYANLSHIVGAQPSGAAVAEVYQQLHGKFTVLVDVLSEIADRAREHVDQQSDLLRLYDRWVRTGSERVRRLLVDKGLVPATAPTEYIQ